MSVEYQISSVRVQCQECETSLKNIEHPVLLQDEETRLDLCYSCFSRIQSDLQYLARWKYKGDSPRQAEEDRERLQKIARDMAEYFQSAPSRFSFLYHINVMKVLYLERLKVLREARRTIKQGKLVLSFKFEEEEFPVYYEPFSEETLLKVTEEFAP